MENNDSWVYYNGELYHAGVKGMSWGKHLPGTDWWKVATQKYYQTNKIGGSQKYKDVDEKGRTTFRTTYGNNVSTRDKIRANLNVAGQAAKLYGGYISNNAKALGRYGYNAAKTGATKAYNAAKTGATKAYNAVKNGTSKYWNAAKGFSSEKIAKLSEFAKQAYSEARKNVVNFFTIDDNELSRHEHNMQMKLDPNMKLSQLDIFENKQLEDAVSLYRKGKENGSFGERVNYWIQNAQYGIVKGVNDYLKQIEMNDEVENFMSKFSKRNK